VALYPRKKKKKWILKALDRRTRRTIAWVVGSRNATTVKRLYEKIKHCKNATFFTDDWDSFAKVLPKERHVIGKAHTIAIEQDNSNTRHHLARMTRRTKVVSRSENMMHISMKLWCALSSDETFQSYQKIFLSIFR